MPNPLNTINALIPSSSFDSVAIFDQNYNQIFRNARSIKAVVKEQSKLMEHPLETGAIITDHRIVMPVEIDLSLILSSSDYQDVYKSIRQFYLQATLLIVQTRSGIYENQIIASLPHEEDPNMYNALAIALSLKQVIFVSAQYTYVPKYATNANTSNRGTQIGLPANTQQTSTSYNAFNYVANGASKLFHSFGSIF